MKYFSETEKVATEKIIEKILGILRTHLKNILMET